MKMKTVKWTPREHPILFSGEMVRAIKEGRKTQTRRVVKPQPRVSDLSIYFKDGCIWKGDEPGKLCPYGQPGDRLWVRETFLIDDHALIDGRIPKERPKDLEAERLLYRADGTCCVQIGECACGEYGGRSFWRPSIHMPRWASRITLEIVNVRVERLQEISEEDCLAEGFGAEIEKVEALVNGWPYGKREMPEIKSKGREWFEHRIWNPLNSKRGFPWSSNPWVWVVEFRRIET